MVEHRQAGEAAVGIVRRVALVQHSVVVVPLVRHRWQHALGASMSLLVRLEQQHLGVLVLREVRYVERDRSALARGTEAKPAELTEPAGLGDSALGRDLEPAW